MKKIVLVGVFALIGAQITGINGDRIRSWLDGEDTHRVDAAIEVRCDAVDAGERTRCARELRHDFAEGRGEPEAIVRRHCTRFASDWALEPEPPLPICDELYGGWIEG